MKTVSSESVKIVHHVPIRAENVIDNHNGTYTIVLRGEEMSLQHQQMLEELFPNLSEKAYELLSQELLLSSLASPADLRKHPLDLGKK